MCSSVDTRARALMDFVKQSNQYSCSAPIVAKPTRTGAAADVLHGKSSRRTLSRVADIQRSGYWILLPLVNNRAVHYWRRPLHRHHRRRFCWPAAAAASSGLACAAPQCASGAAPQSVFARQPPHSTSHTGARCPMGIRPETLSPTLRSQTVTIGKTHAPYTTYTTPPIPPHPAHTPTMRILRICGAADGTRLHKRSDKAPVCAHHTPSQLCQCTHRS